MIGAAETKMKGHFLVTGASGFIGRALVQHLVAEQCRVTAMSRNACVMPGPSWAQVSGYRDPNELGRHLAGVDTVVHLAARAHQMDELQVGTTELYNNDNVVSTQTLARAARIAGVHRFIFISSIGVNGNSTHRLPFRETDLPSPVELYAKSKLAAEHAVLEECHGATQPVIIRPPLVYGPAAPGNFGRLLSAIRRGWPLPLGAVKNQRSFISSDNLISFIQLCATHPAAAAETYLVSDGADISTADFLRRLAWAMGRSARLIPVPVALLRLGGRLSGRSAMIDRLCNNLQIDITKARTHLAWVPPISVDEGLRRAVTGHSSASET